jgi:2,5-dihydroxypyridine 5,6-dioxygenase
VAATSGLIDLCERQLTLCGVTEGETVAILSVDEVRREYADAFLVAGSRLGARTVEVHLTGGPSAMSGGGVWAVGMNPLAGNELAIETLKQANLVIDLVFLLHSSEQVEIQRAGARMLLVMEPPETLARLFPTVDDRRRVETSEELLAGTRSLRVTSPAGTDVVYRLGSFPIMTQYGFTDTPGRWDHWPSTFLFTNGDEDGVDGKVVVDRGDIVVAPFLRYVEEPVELTIERGQVEDIRGGLDADLLRDYIAEWNDPRGLAVSHIGWALNERARASRLAAATVSYGMEARSLYGSVMFSTGPNQELGGTNSTPCHIDIPMRGCSLYLDDEPVLLDGEFAIEELRAPYSRFPSPAKLSGGPR